MPPAARARGVRALCVLLLAVTLSACDGVAPLEALLDRGETLRVRGAPPTTLDPALAGDSTSWSYILQIFSGLVRLDDQLAVVPDLAERWDTTDGGRVYTFVLRPDIKFHSGRDVTAEDFKFAMTRALLPATGSRTARQYLGDIVGAIDVLAGREAELRGVQVLDARTLRIEIDAPKSYFLAKLTYPTAFALDRANVESGAEWYQRPNGTGPFRLTEWAPNVKVTLLRFNQHWRGPAKSRSIEFNLDPTPGIVLYEHGEVDMTEIDIGTLGRVSDPTNPLSEELVVNPLASTWYVGMNASQAPFDDPLVRRAFAHATDRDRLVRVFFRGTRVEATGIVPPGLPGAPEGVRVLPFDPAEARRLLALSHYAGRMPEIVLAVGEGSASTGEAFAEMYARNLGLDVGVREHREDFFGALERREAQIFFTGWIADYPHPENFLDILFHSGSNSNYGGYANPELDRLLEAARVEPDAARRDQLYTEAERLIIEDGAAIPLHHEVVHALVRPYVRGITWTPLGILSYHEAEVGERTVRRAA